MAGCFQAHLNVYLLHLILWRTEKENINKGDRGEWEGVRQVHFFFLTLKDLVFLLNFRSPNKARSHSKYGELKSYRGFQISSPCATTSCLRISIYFWSSGGR